MSSIRRIRLRGSKGARPGPLLLCVLASLLLTTGAADAATIGYWRMEVDDDPSANGLSTPNEMSFGTPLVSAEAVLDGSNLPTTSVPLTSAVNDFSIASAFQSGTAGINASAAWYAELAVSSISIEFWARTQETTATPFYWSSGGVDGIILTDPNSLDLTWHVSVGGTPTAYTMSNLDNMSAAWTHYGFVYDETSGEARFFVDGAQVSYFDGPDNSPLVLLANTPIQIGVLMDYATAGQGTMDELRIDGTALPPVAFLLPEPGTGLLLGFGLFVLGVLRRRH